LEMEACKIYEKSRFFEYLMTSEASYPISVRGAAIEQFKKFLRGEVL
jgi:hypothetical protein